MRALLRSADAVPFSRVAPVVLRVVETGQDPLQCIARPRVAGATYAPVSGGSEPTRAPLNGRYRAPGMARRSRLSGYSFAIADEFDVNAMIQRFQARARAVRQRALPPVEGAERKRFMDQARLDFQDYAMIGDAIARLEDGVLTLTVDLRPKPEPAG
jgi:hypothetical protein